MCVCFQILNRISKYVKNVLQGLVYYFLISMDLNVISKHERWLFAIKIHKLH